LTSNFPYAISFGGEEKRDEKRVERAGNERKGGCVYCHERMPFFFFI